MRFFTILTGNEKINSDQVFQKATTTELRGHSLNPLVRVAIVRFVALISLVSVG